ncbi:MAG TPA: DUF1127 domain-containing protein [Alphaproteobacteria bacterium]|nr:DUF1127 domain-containing protein [Alphaproteobacteria bacterium]
MTERENRRGHMVAQATTRPGARATTGLSELFETLDAFLVRIGVHARKRDRQRKAARELALMSDYTLRDIGLHRSEILSVTHNLQRFERDRRAGS